MNSYQPIPFRHLIDLAVEPARRNLRKMWLPAAVPLAAAAAIAAFGQVGWLRSLGAAEEDPFALVAGGLMMFGAALLTMAAYTVCYAVLVFAAADAVSGRPVDMWRSWKFTMRPQVLGIVALVTFLSVLSALFCLFPALYVVPLLSFTLPVMAEEGRTGLEAMRRSVRLTRYSPTNRLWDAPWILALGVLFVGWMVTNAFGFLVQLPFAVVQQVYTLREAGAGEAADPMAVMSVMAWTQVPMAVLNALATTAGWIYLACALCALFLEVRRRQEGDDLERAIDLLVGTGSRAGDGA